MLCYLRADPVDTQCALPLRSGYEEETEELRLKLNQIREIMNIFDMEAEH